MRYSKLGYWGTQAGAFAFVAVVSTCALWLIPREMLVARGAVLASAAAIGLLIGLYAYRSADEVILATHKTSWFWGSMAAIIVVEPLTIAVMLGIVPAPALLPLAHRAPADWFAEGVAVALLIQCAGFGLFWAYLNFGKRT